VPAFKHVTTTAYDLAGQRLREKVTQGSAV
jgi:YD repeat-containing protein